MFIIATSKTGKALQPCLSVCLFTNFPPTPHQLVRRMQEKLGLQESKNTFALYEQNALWEQPVAGSTLIADILTRFEKLTSVFSL